MKRTLTYALGAVLTGAVMTPALAQENFPDAQENHWAYEALLNMKKAGLLVGYPDGLFRGNRPASRYELAVAIHATYQHLKGLADGLAGQIKALEDKIGTGSGGGDTSGLATKAELQAVRDALAQAQAAINGMRSWGDDIANLKRMASTFEKELASLGVDVEAMKKGLNDLANRVTALEKRKLPVDISGTFNLLGIGGYSEDRRFGISKDGRPTGVSKEDGDPAGIAKDLNIWHQGYLTFTTTNEDGPKGKATVAMGNVLAQGYSIDGFPREGFHPSIPLAGVPYGDNNETDIYFQEFEASFKTSALGQDLSVRAGRIGKKTGGYFFQRPDFTPDYKDEYFDNGMWYFDGVDFGLNFGNVGVDIFGGRQSTRYTSDGTEPWGMWAGNYGHPFEPGGDTGNNPSRPRGLSSLNGIMVDQHLGVVLNIPLMEKGKINLQYLMLDSNSSSTLSGSPFVAADRTTVFGGEVWFPIGGNIKLNAGYSQTNMSQGSDTVVDEDNAAWWAGASYEAGEKWGIMGGYRHIDPQFYAPGSWGRIGFWYNPTDVQGFHVGGWFNLTDKTKIMAHGEFLTGADVSLGGSRGLSEDDSVDSLRIKVEHKINDSWSAYVGGEWVRWDIADRNDSEFEGGKPRENWYDLGFKYMFNENSWWSLVWQVSDYDAKGVFGFNPFAFDSGQDRATGGKITTQLSVRFKSG